MPSYAVTCPSLCPFVVGFRTIVPILYIAFARVVLFATLGAAASVSTLGGVIGVVLVFGLAFPTLGPMTLVVRSFPIFWRHRSVSVPGVPGVSVGPVFGCWTISRISVSRRFILSSGVVSGNSQQVGKNSRVLETRFLPVLVMWHL